MPVFACRPAMLARQSHLNLEIACCWMAQAISTVRPESVATSGVTRHMAAEWCSNSRHN